MKKEILRISRLDWGYNGKSVLKDVTLRIPEGSFTGIIGPNGAGKTTLLKLVLSLLPPEKRSIFIDGRDTAGLSRKIMARTLSYVPQTPGVDFGFTVKEMVAMGRNPHIQAFSGGTPEDESIINKAIEDTRIEHLRSKNVQTISGGELQRVIIARALAQNPSILALDEPTNHLDLNHQIKILSLIKKLSTEKGITVLAVLHDFNHALQYCDNLVLMDKGTVTASGLPEEVITPEIIERMYHLEIAIEKNPFTGKPYMVVKG